jgi:DNA-binding response OmpR family regulator
MPRLNKQFKFPRLFGKPARARRPLVVKVLVLEDHLGIRSALELLLEWEGYEVVAFGRGDDALEFLSTRDVDMLLMDWNTPGICGMDFLEALDETCLPLFRPRIGVLSGDRNAQRAVTTFGAEFFFLKPFAPSDLVQKIVSPVSRQALM